MQIIIYNMHKMDTVSKLHEKRTHTGFFNVSMRVREYGIALTK